MAIDLDAARAARREAKGQGPVVVFNKKKYKLPVEVPYSAMEKASLLETDPSAENVAAMIKALLGEHYDAIMAQNPSVEDINALVEGIMEEYGLGNSAAS